MATTKDLEARLDELEERLGRLESATGAPPPDGPDTAGGGLEARVARLENLTGNRMPDVAERVAADMALVSRFANSREEAIAQQAARERLAELGLIDAHGRVRTVPAPDAEDGAEQPGDD